ncbi:TPA: hypothetical protein NG603_004457 [Vibrio parahaemolyticus]|nr:hypothetical protein [Vibrio parahaemolyticus]
MSGIIERKYNYSAIVASVASDNGLKTMEYMTLMDLHCFLSYCVMFQPIRLRYRLMGWLGVVQFMKAIAYFVRFKIRGFILGKPYC